MKTVSEIAATEPSSPFALQRPQFILGCKSFSVVERVFVIDYRMGINRILAFGWVKRHEERVIVGYGLKRVHPVSDTQRCIGIIFHVL